VWGVSFWGEAARKVIFRILVRNEICDLSATEDKLDETSVVQLF
jgi:hypothetical protein